jgi:hypothetical protein
LKIAENIVKFQAMGRSRGRGLQKPSQPAELHPALIKLESKEFPASTKMDTVKTRPESMLDKKGTINS